MDRPAPVTGPLTAAIFADALRSGIHRVLHEQESLNRINVFPVADGDTGTNLCLSLGASLQQLSRPSTDHLGTVLAALADVLLDSARGNSGAILAQFFQGMSDAAQDVVALTATSLSHAVSRGSDYARDALANPREGTILSVIAAFATSLRRQASVDGQPDIAAMLVAATSAANEALARTQDQLEVLRRAGVVDAGARGFVTLVEGFAAFVAEGTITEAPALADVIAAESTRVTAGEDAELRYRYCTECVINGQEIDRRRLRERLAVLGDSLVLAGTKRKAKIHIHADDPDRVFEVARAYGELSGIKADDMLTQQHSTHRAQIRFAVITDSAADIADEDMERLDIHMVPCRIQFGEKSYLDKVSITTAEFFEALASHPRPPTTSQPSPGDFRRQYQYLASHFPDVISIGLTPTVSGTLQAARSAAARTRASGTVHVVDSRNASLGQGLIAVYAAECAEAGLDAATTLQALDAIIPVTRSFALIRDLSSAVRGGRVPPSRQWLADWLRLTPVISTRPDGTLSTAGVLPGRHNLLSRFARYVARRSNPDVPLNLAIAHAICEEDAARVRDELEALLPNLRRTTLTGLGAALGAHGGPGSIVVGVQEHRDPLGFT